MRQTDVKAITAQEMQHYSQANLDSDYLIVDVRQPEEYEEHHIPGARLIPINELIKNFTLLPSDKNLIFYCLGGQRSYSAGFMTIEEECTDKTVYHLEGGISAWQGKTIPHYPRFDALILSQGLPELLLSAMNLEKGSLLFYTHCANHFKNHPLHTLFESLSIAEQDHGRLIFNHWQKQKHSSQTFNSVFNALSGNLVESGSSLSELVGTITSLSSPGMDVIDMILAIENMAYDLYRNVAEKLTDSDIKHTFYSLSQAEKKHIKTIINRIAD